MDGSPITVAQVRALVPAYRTKGPPVRIAGEPSQGPWRRALERAIRDELLAREAASRHIDAETRAGQIAALIDAQTRARERLQATKIPDAEALAWYKQHRPMFDEPDQAKVMWAALDKRALARRMFERAAHVDAQAFKQLIVKASVVNSGTTTTGNFREDVDPMVARMVFAASEGDVALVKAPDDQRWWLALIVDLSFSKPAWDDRLASQVKSALAWERTQEYLDRFAHSLQKRWPVHVYTSRLAAHAS